MGCDCRSKTAQCYRHLGYWAAAGARVSTNRRLLGPLGEASPGLAGLWDWDVLGKGKGVRPVVLCLFLLLVSG